MRLLQLEEGKLCLTDDLQDELPPYAILSHTWGPDREELTLHDVMNGPDTRKPGYSKARFCGEQAKIDGLQYFWVDSCCIDKRNHVELSEAIISMFRWYRDAAICYVYLSDVSIGTGDNQIFAGHAWKSEFRKSRWFTRGWTLQELLAPRSVAFYSREGKWLGDKTTLEQDIHDITAIPVNALRGDPLSNFGIKERMQWATKRKTKRKEDMAYCLLGIFQVFLSPLYGEEENAFIRLEDEIERSTRRKLGETKSPDTSRRPVWHVPFGRASGFVGRIDELNLLKDKIFASNGSQVMSILGLGGIGKSRLALELTYHIKEEHPQFSILWIDATNQLTFERGVLEIGIKLEIPGITDDGVDVKGLLKQWLGHESLQRWLLILDNADEEGVWGRKSSPIHQKTTLVDWLASTTNGAILVTTRSRRVAVHLAGKEITELRAMTTDEARNMFTNALESPGMAADQNATAVLVDRLTCLPLAITQAASYLNMTQETVETYLELMDEPEEEVMKLLGEDFGDQTRNSSAHNAVATTWLISFTQIRDHHPLAAQYLSSMACFHEKNIPQSLLPNTGSKQDIIKAISTLKGYSFITKQAAEYGNINHDPLYNIHRLVRLAARNWLKVEGTLTSSTKACITRVAERFPPRNHQHRSIWAVYLPHAQRLCEDDVVQDLPERYKLLEMIGRCFMADGKYDEAVKMHKLVAEWRETKLGALEQETLNAYDNLGQALVLNGNFPDALMNLGRARQGRREILGEEHPDTLQSMHNLASAFLHMKRWQEAEKLLVQVMKTTDQVFGEENPKTIDVIADLATTYIYLDRLQEGENLLAQVRKTRQKVLGEEHPDTLTCMNNLAVLYMYQKRWQEAEGIYEQVLKTRKNVLGELHPNTLTSMNNLAICIKIQGRKVEAVERMVECIRLQGKVLGDQHPRTLNSSEMLAEWESSS